MQTKYGPQNHSCESFDRNKWAVNIQRIYLVLLCRIWKIPLCNESFFFALWESWKIKNHLWNMSIFSLFSSINRPFLTSSFQVFLFLLKKSSLNDCFEVLLQNNFSLKRKRLKIVRFDYILKCVRYSNFEFHTVRQQFSLIKLSFKVKSEGECKERPKRKSIHWV